MTGASRGAWDEVARDQLVDALGSLLASEPGMAERLEVQHQPTEAGDCRGCVQWERPTHRWPCNIYKAVQAVRGGWLSGGSGSSPSGQNSNGHLRAVPDEP